MVSLGIGGGLAFGIIGAWTGNEKFFAEIILPVLNRSDPEVTHRLAVNIAKYHLTRAASSDNPSNLVCSQLTQTQAKRINRSLWS